MTDANQRLIEDIQEAAAWVTTRQVKTATLIVDRINIYGREAGALRYGNEEMLITVIARALASELRHGAELQRRATESNKLMDKIESSLSSGKGD